MISLLFSLPRFKTTNLRGRRPSTMERAMITPLPLVAVLLITVICLEHSTYVSGENTTEKPEALVWQKLYECPNKKGVNETCGIGDFCSNDPIQKGCRPCSDIFKQWCAHDSEQFRYKYPSCTGQCEVLKANSLEKTVSALQNDIAELHGTLSRCNITLGTKAIEVTSLKKTVLALQNDMTAQHETLSRCNATLATKGCLFVADNQPLVAAFIGVTVTLSVMLIAALGVAYHFHKKLRNNATTNAQELPKPINVSGNDDPNDQRERERLINSTPISQPASDSGRESDVVSSCDNSSTSSSNNTLSDLRVTAGGTDHNLCDTKDFVKTLPRGDEGATAMIV